MSRKYLNDRWCVRCGRMSPCPYLVKNVGLFKDVQKSDPVVDCGCGNGRNSKYLSSLGFENIYSLDMAGDFGIKCVLGKDKINAQDNSAGLVLCNYVFMFLDDEERKFLINEINRISKNGCFLMVELYPAKDSYCKTEESVVDFQDMLYNQFNKAGWEKIRYSKKRFILKKQNEMQKM